MAGKPPNPQLSVIPLFLPFIYKSRFLNFFMPISNRPIIKIKEIEILKNGLYSPVTILPGW